MTVVAQTSQASQDASPTGEATGNLLDGYAPLQGAYDECMDDTGAVRPAWREAFDIWNGQSARQRQARHQAAERYLRDNGVAHRVYGDDHSIERPWPLSPMPLIIGADEWARLEQGLIQRANLLEAVLADLYGPQTLINGGHLPASLVAGAPGFLRPLVGAQPKGGYHLHYIAIELGRGPDGRWWVLGDRTQAPSGTGYALENRMATSRSMGAELRRLQVKRLGGFFHGFRETLGGMKDAASTRVGLLTPGPFNETYYEQAFLARYLGFLLLEGGDLIMRDNALFVRTVRGLKEIDVLWRRVDADFCDPLALRGDSRLGVPGLVHAVRAGRVACINALGAGLMESRGLMAYMPGLARSLLGEDLRLPNIATWWRGDAAMRAEADRAMVDTLRLSAFGTGLPFGDPGEFHNDEPTTSEAAMVSQEAVRLSTMPVLQTDDSGDPPRLTPRPFSLRLFLARTPSGWSVMPGGFARVSDSNDTRALSMQDGSLSCDVWVRSDDPVQSVSLLSSTGQRKVRRVPGTLPSRAADNLFWLGRYTERAQLCLRLARAYQTRYADSIASEDGLLAVMEEHLAMWNIADPAAPEMFASQLLPDLRNAHRTASAIRDRFSPDAWQTLNSFIARADSPAFAALSPTEQIDAALGMLAAFAGLASENMIRLSGWRFLEIGRRLERAMGTCQLAHRFAYGDQTKRPHPPGSYDLLLETADSVMSYRQRYSITTERDTVVDLVVLDPNNPRSVGFQLERIYQHLNEITDHQAFEQETDLQRLAFSMWSRMHTMRVEDLKGQQLATLQQQLARLSEAISATFIRPGLGGHTLSA